jgi:hypothetical protein
VARNKKPLSWVPVEIERDGKKYSGRYTVERRLITVVYNGRTKYTQLGGGSGGYAIATALLSELVGAATRH